MLRSLGRLANGVHIQGQDDLWIAPSDDSARDKGGRR